MHNTIKLAIRNIQYIRENKKYIDIGIRKYKEGFNFDILISEINSELNLNILATGLEELGKRLEELEPIYYMDIVDKIGLLTENLSAVISEEINPMLPKFNKTEKESESFFEEER